jgi:hypothetical protein
MGEAEERGGCVIQFLNSMVRPQTLLNPLEASICKPRLTNKLLAVLANHLRDLRDLTGLNGELAGWWTAAAKRCQRLP